VVNRFNRLEITKNCYLTERSDVLEGLHILQPLIKLSKQESEPGAEKLLQDIKANGLLQQRFTVTELKNLLQQRRATIKRKLYLLIESGHVVRLSGNRKNGYIYKVVKMLNGQ
jgi:transcription initiation factor IIE alpha subunit